MIQHSITHTLSSGYHCSHCVSEVMNAPVLDVLPGSHSWPPGARCEAIPRRGVALPAKLTALFSFPLHRCMYVGDTDAWCEAFSRSEEQ